MGSFAGAPARQRSSTGRRVRLTADNDSDSEGAFTGWSGAGCNGTEGCEVTIDGAKSVEARFVTPSGGAYLVYPSDPG